MNGVEEPKRKKLCSEKSELSYEQAGEGGTGNYVFNRCIFLFLGTIKA